MKDDSTLKHEWFIDVKHRILALGCIYKRDIWRVFHVPPTSFSFTQVLMLVLSKCYIYTSISSIPFSHSVMSDSLWPHEPQQARPPCPSPTPGVDPNSCPLSQWCQPATSSSVVPFSSCPQSFPVSGSFQMSQLFASGGQSIGVSASTSVQPGAHLIPTSSPSLSVGWDNERCVGQSAVH